MIGRQQPPRASRDASNRRRGDALSPLSRRLSWLFACARDFLSAPSAWPRCAAPRL